MALNMKDYDYYFFFSKLRFEILNWIMTGTVHLNFDIILSGYCVCAVVKKRFCQGVKKIQQN